MTRLTALLTSLVCLVSTVAFAAPTITDVSPRGIRIGGTTTLTVTGSELTADTKIILPVELAKQKVLADPKPNQVKIEVTLPANTPVGIYQLRVATGRGISNPLAVGLDSLPQTGFVDKVDSLPIAMTGNLTGSQILRTTFRGKANQRVVVDLESRRLGAKLRPVLRLLDGRGAQIAWSPAKGSIGGDARCEAILAADGEYSVEFHDLLYRGENPGFYRLKIGDLHYADYSLPLGINRDKADAKRRFVSSSLPADREFVWKANSSWADAPNLTGAQPRVTLTDHAEVVETPQADNKLQTISQAPVAISGVIASKGEEDRYLLTVKPGSKLRFDVQSQQIGSPLDGVLSIRGEKGNNLASNDDRGNTSDPGLDYTVPGNINKVVVALKDLHSRGGTDFIYRIAIRDLGKPDFQVSVTNDRINVPTSGNQVLRLNVTRSGYNEAIKLSGDSLPNGVTLANTEIPAGDNVGLLIVNAKDGAGANVGQLIAQSEDGSIKRSVQLNPTPITSYQPNLRTELGVATDASGSPIRVDWTPADDAKLWLGGRYHGQAKVTRKDNGKGPVRLSLLTTQVPPMNKGKPDVGKTLRIDGSPEIEMGATDGKFQVITPASLPQRDWGLAVKAELLSADKKQVMATTISPVRRLAALQACKLELKNPKATTITAKAGDGDTGKFVGKITRSPGITQPVTITLAGLPKGYAVPKVELASDKSDFELEVRFPAGTKPAELKNIRLVATLLLDAKDPKSVLRSNEQGVTIKVVAGKK